MPSTLDLLAGSDQEFAKGLAELGWYRYPPTLADRPFCGRARPNLSVRFRQAGQVQGAGAWVYRLEIDSRRWSDAVAVVESHLRSQPEFAVVFVNLGRTLLVLVPEDPDRALRQEPGIRVARLELDIVRPANYEKEAIRRLRQAPDQGFRRRLQEVVNADRVTRSFYEEFFKVKTWFVEQIQGIASAEDAHWYASVLLNRLMFIYFVQDNLFLAGNATYLRDNLAESSPAGSNYYRDFLCPLFFQGLALSKEERDPAVRSLLGDIPYLDGGLFLKHKIECDYPGIAIDNEAFAKVFRLFDDYTWHIDDRPLTSERQINPDVLGYIFEKYVNERAEQKKSGAYYTKEDITGYICRNTIIPRLFDMLAEARGQGESAPLPFSIPAIEPYVYAAVKHGIEHPLPEEIAAGIPDVSKRGGWNRPAPEEFALPTEIWREVVARRQRYESILQDFQDGKIKTADDFITFNLDMEKMAADFVDGITDASLLSAFYFQCLKRITVLDPTCGSGAFLFAALKILAPLYERCLLKMEALCAVPDTLHPTPYTLKGEFAFANEVDAQQAFLDPDSADDPTIERFRAELAEVHQHSLRYHVHKSIIVNNLFGVDIMEEAVEICKLRLFLHLIGQAEPDDSKPNLGIEPLPDIDFNILCGNTLVGYARIEDVEGLRRKVTTSSGDTIGAFDLAERDSQLKMMVENYRIKLDYFRREQLGEKVPVPTPKEAVIQAGDEIRPRLHKELFETYKSAGKATIEVKNARTGKTTFRQMNRDEFKTTHQPFYWFLEFPSATSTKGFDAIVGNPPYVEYSKVANRYKPLGNEAESCGNLYALIAYQSIQLLRRSGRFGFIVPISLVCTQRMQVLQEILTHNDRSVWVSNFAERPSKLFVGAEVLLTIVLTGREGVPEPQTYSTGFIKWASEERPHLFAGLTYSQASLRAKPFVIPKVGSTIDARILAKLLHRGGNLGASYGKKTDFAVYYRIGGGRYWKIFTNFQPPFTLNGERAVSSRESYIFFPSAEIRDAVISILSSSLFYWYFVVTTNCRDLNPIDLFEFPLDPAILTTEQLRRLSHLSQTLMADYMRNSVAKEKTSSLTGHIVYQEYYPRQSKAILDQIDEVIGAYYGFTAEQLDHVINFEVKYRMGRDGETEEEAE